MKDGVASVYISLEDFENFIKEKGNFKEDTLLVIGRPILSSEDVIFNIAFSETGVHPKEWGGSGMEKVNKIKESWNEIK